MKNCNYSEQRYYDRAIFYGSAIRSSAVRANVTQRKIWLMFAGLIETADMVRFDQ